ncbi:hypothetical protein L3X38_039332 [Prunus dulcis]|uniref:P-loop containing nucleoside triphosphate hydrolases superfamily protein n=1 Tax=Prunus dulcis TaxID=3755 RepID=A0AAD4V8A8_PRUDU|nr:hypothetical protein L3X38_039332 [Prunus dulcis]
MFSLNDLKGQMSTTASTLFSAYASFATCMMLLRSMAKELIPEPFRTYLFSAINYLLTPFFSTKFTLIVDEHSGMIRNQVYDAADLYLRTKIGPSTERLRVSKTPRKKDISAMTKDEEVADTFDNVKLRWRFLSESKKVGKNNKNVEKRFFELTFSKKHKDKVLNSYLPFVLARAKAIKDEQKVVKLYTRHLWPSSSHDEEEEEEEGNSYWGSVNLEHPSTFETMAMEPELKRAIVEDMDRFVRRREFYKKVGKAWKRGYLLYGPPGTGKSSLIAAMANYLKFNVYDLELASIYSDSHLRRVLLSTTNRSILVIEDIDCCRVDAGNRAADSKSKSKSKSDSEDRVTLPGFLNFKLW